MTAKALLERIIKIRKAIDYRRTKIDALTEQAEKTEKLKAELTDAMAMCGVHSLSQITHALVF